MSDNMVHEEVSEFNLLLHCHRQPQLRHQVLQEQEDLPTYFYTCSQCYITVEVD